MDRPRRGHRRRPARRRRRPLVRLGGPHREVPDDDDPGGLAVVRALPLGVAGVAVLPTDGPAPSASNGYRQAPPLDDESTPARHYSAQKYALVRARGELAAPPPASVDAVQGWPLPAITRAECVAWLSVWVAASLVWDETVPHIMDTPLTGGEALARLAAGRALRDYARRLAAWEWLGEDDVDGQDVADTVAAIRTYAVAITPTATGLAIDAASVVGSQFSAAMGAALNIVTFVPELMLRASAASGSAVARAAAGAAAAALRALLRVLLSPAGLALAAAAIGGLWLVTRPRVVRVGAAAAGGPAAAAAAAAGGR